MKTVTRTLMLALSLAAASTASAQSAARPDVATAKIETFLAALSTGDEKAFNAVTTPDYRAFENGRIYDRKAFFDLVQKGIRDGMRPKFRISDTRSTIGDRVAAVNYINHDSYAVAGAMKDISWLEIVTLRRDAGDWRIDFLDSQIQSTEPKK